MQPLFLFWLKAGNDKSGSYRMDCPNNNTKCIITEHIVYYHYHYHYRQFYLL